MCQTLLVSGNLMICPGPTTLKQFPPRPGAWLPSSIVSPHPIVMPTLFWLYISFPSLDVGPTSKDGLGSYLTQCNTLLWKLQVTLELKLSDQFKITPLINTTSNFWSPLSFLMVSCTSLGFFLFIGTLLILEPLTVSNCYDHLLRLVLFIILFLFILFVELTSCQPCS